MTLPRRSDIELDRGKSYGGLALGSFVNTIAYAAAGRHWWSLAAAVLCLAFLVGLAAFEFWWFR